MNNLTRIFTFTLLLAVASIAGAQVPADTVQSVPGVEVRTSVDKSEIFVGDLVTYTLTIFYDSTIELLPPPLGANLGSFHVIDYETDKIERLADGRYKSTNRFVISTFTTGEYIVPPIPVTVIMPDSSRRVVVSEGVPITVESLLAGQDSAAIAKLDIKPIAAPVEFERDYTWYYIYAAIALLLVAGIVAFFIWRRRRPVAQRKLDPREPWEIAYERLALLMHRDLVADGQFKTFYYELDDIVRWFLGEVYDAHALDMTTEEFLEHFRAVKLPESSYDGIEAFMTHADLVKFAKYEPSKDQSKYDFEFVHSLIDRVRKDIQLRRVPQVETNTHDEPVAPTGGGAE